MPGEPDITHSLLRLFSVANIPSGRDLMEFEAKYLWNNSNKKYISQKWMVPSTLSDQLARRWIASTFIIPDELSLENMISSHVKRSPFLRLHKKRAFRRRSKWNYLVFHWCPYTKKNITWLLGDSIHMLNKISQHEKRKSCRISVRRPCDILCVLMYWFKENLNSQLSQICQFLKNFLWKKCNAVWREISVE